MTWKSSNFPVKARAQADLNWVRNRWQQGVTRCRAAWLPSPALGREWGWWGQSRGHGQPRRLASLPVLATRGPDPSHPPVPAQFSQVLSFYLALLGALYSTGTKDNVLKTFALTSLGR